MSLIPTFKQFDRKYRRNVSRRYDVTLAELAIVYKPNHYKQEWWKATVAAYEAGGVFSPQHWRSLNEWQQREILRTHRALSMPGNVQDPWKIPA